MSIGRGRGPDRPARDLSGAAVVVMAFLAMAAIVWLDLTDGTLGLAFSVGFILVAITAPMAVDLRSIVTTGVLPPPLLIVTLFGVALIEPGAIEVPGLAVDAGTITRTIGTTLDHGVTLVIGHALALTTIVLRNVWASRARVLSLQRA
ncbi:MAG TPA: DUF6542 domain-containing protein [Aeromicrobium sp.]|nr:DUF6542 domain-containing protein [Aeromicrobium sp.]